MKIEWTNKIKIPFSQVSQGQCFLDENDNVCLACEEGWAVVLATGELFEMGASHAQEVKPISAKVVVSEVE